MSIYGNNTWQLPNMVYTIVCNQQIRAPESFVSFLFQKENTSSNYNFATSTTKRHSAHISGASMGKLACTEYLIFGGSQDRFQKVSSFKNDSNYLDVKLEIFKRDDNRDFQPAQIFTLVESHSKKISDWGTNWYFQQKRTKKIEKDKLWFPIPITTTSLDMEEQLKSVQKIVDYLDRPNRKSCLTQLQYGLEKPIKSSTQVQRFTKKKDARNFSKSSKWITTRWIFISTRCYKICICWIFSYF